MIKGGGIVVMGKDATEESWMMVGGEERVKGLDDDWRGG